MRKSGEAILDTNVWIVIGIVSLVVILGIFFFYGDKIQNTLSNLLPEYETDSGIDEVIASDGDISVLYPLEIGEFSGSEKKTSEELDGYNVESINAFYKNFLTNFVVLSVVKNGRELVKLKSYADNNVDPDSKTNAVRISFQDGDDVNVDFLYDAKEKRVFFGNVNNGVLLDCKQIDFNKVEELISNNYVWSSTDAVSYSLGDFSKDAEDLSVTDLKDIETICSSKDISSFISSIISVVDKEKEWKYTFGLYGDDQYLSVGSNFYATIPGDSLEKKKTYLSNLLTRNRPYYTASWGLDGIFLDNAGSLTKEISYSCLLDNSYSSDLDTEHFDCVKQQYRGNTALPSSWGYCFCDTEFAGNLDCPKGVFLTDSSKNYQVFYLRGGEIWVAEYGAEVQNYCYRGVVPGSSCN